MSYPTFTEGQQARVVKSPFSDLRKGEVVTIHAVKRKHLAVTPKYKADLYFVDGGYCLWPWELENA